MLNLYTTFPIVVGSTGKVTLSYVHIDQKRAKFPKDIKQRAWYAKGQKDRLLGNY